MKKTFIYFALFLFIGIAARAQAPQLVNYQGVARNTSGVPLQNTTLGLRLTVHDGSAAGTAVYQETQAPLTNSFGLYNVAIGNGTIVSGTLAGIAWGVGDKYLQVEIDPAGGSAYVDAGTSQLLSVPYAIYADKADMARTVTGTVTLAGDVTGTNAASTVVKLNGNSVSATVPASGQVLTWNSGTSTWVPATPATWGSVTSITAGTGLSGGVITGSGTISMPAVGTAGTYGSATIVPVITTDAEGRVTSISNTTIAGDNWGTQVVQEDATLAGSGTALSHLTIAQQGATSGQALEWNGSTWMPATIPTPTTYSAGAGLSLTGTTFSAQTTAAIWNANELQSNPVSATAPTTGQGLLWSGTAWAPTTIPSTTYTSGTGITVAGTVINAQTTTALWNANELQGKTISGTAPVSGQVLEWTGAAWTPTSVGGVGTVTSIVAGTGLSGGTITSSGTISLPAVGTPGTYGSATIVPVITTDAEGRVSSISNTTISGDNWGTQVVQTDATLTGSGTTASHLAIAQQGATTGQAMEWNGTTWMPATIPAPTTYSAGTGLSLTGTTFSAQNTTALWNADELQGKNISATAPTAGQELTYNAGTSTWTPTNPSGGTVTSITAGAGLSGGTITSSGTISMPNVGTIGTYGSATQVPVLTTDAQGRITGVTNTTITGPTYTGGTGISITGTTVSALNTTALWNAVSLQGNSVSVTAPTTGQLLSWSGTAWTPTTVAIPTVSGTTNYISKFTSATAVGNSQVFDNGTSVGIGTIVPAAANKLQVINSSPTTFTSAVHGISVAAAGGAVGTTAGVFGESNTGVGILGLSSAVNAIYGWSTAGGYAGVAAVNTGTGGYGLWASVSSTGDAGMFDGGTGGGFGVIVNEGASGFGTLYPRAMVHDSGSKDVTATLGGYTFGNQALIAQTSTTATTNVANAIIGFSANSSFENHGLFGLATGTGASDNVGAFCLAAPLTTITGNCYGIYGSASNGASNVGVYGTNSGTGYAGYFYGTLYATTGTFGTKPFKIDDPRDPANKYLYHSCIESNEMMDLYKGHVTTDANGDATVTLPSYFMILNKEYDYQLTCIGQFAQAIVSEEISGNQFKIKTDKPNVKVSWQVSGVRQDPVANAYRIVDEVEKPASEKGTYLQPEVYGMGPEKALFYHDPKSPNSIKPNTNQASSNQAPAAATQPATRMCGTDIKQ